MVGLLVAICLLGADKAAFDIDSFIQNDFAVIAKPVVDSLEANRPKKMALAIKELHSSIEGKDVSVRIKVKGLRASRQRGVYLLVGSVLAEYQNVSGEGPVTFLSTWEDCRIDPAIADRLEKGSILTVKGSPRFTRYIAGQNDPSLFQVFNSRANIAFYFHNPRFSIE